MSDQSVTRNKDETIRIELAKMLEISRHLCKTMTEIHELSDPRSNTPLQDLERIRIKASVSLRSAVQSGLLP